MEPTLRPWEALKVTLPKPDQHSYGYVRGQKIVGCSREELLRICNRIQWHSIRYVWTPETPGMVSPEEVPFLFTSLRNSNKNGALATAAAAVVLGFAGLVLVLINGFDKTAVVVTLFFFGIPSVLCAAHSIYQIIKIRRTTQESLTRRISTKKYFVWLASQKTTYTPAIVAAIGAVALAQVAVMPQGRSSIVAAGLSPAAVQNGQYWRLLTCTLMHGGIWHFWMNITALMSLGRLTEVFTERSFLPIVFLSSAIVGSIFSFYLPPDSTSIGASGGLMGVFGFLAVAAFRRRDVFPEGFLKTITLNIILIAGVGIVAFMFIDNAAHAGGLASGTGLGFLFIKKGDRSFPMRIGKTTQLSGRLSLFIIGAVASLSIAAIYEFSTVSVAASFLLLAGATYLIIRFNFFQIMSVSGTVLEMPRDEIIGNRAPYG